MKWRKADTRHVENERQLLISGPGYNPGQVSGQGGLIDYNLGYGRGRTTQLGLIPTLLSLTNWETMDAVNDVLRGDLEDQCSSSRDDSERKSCHDDTPAATLLPAFLIRL